MIGIEAAHRWAKAKDALDLLDTTRPNPKGILSSTIRIKIERGYRPPSVFHSAITSDGREYYFVDWIPASERLLDYYYAYRGGDGLFFQDELQKVLARKGFQDRLDQLINAHDGEEGRATLSEDDFLNFMTKEDVLVPGPLPATIESIVLGEGTALWMPKYLYLLTSSYGQVNRPGWVNQQDR